jgi:hypothetical protein
MRMRTDSKRRKSGYYFDEVAAIINNNHPGARMDEGGVRALCPGDDDGDVDLGVALHRYEEAKRRDLMDTEHEE